MQPPERYRILIDPEFRIDTEGKLLRIYEVIVKAAMEEPNTLIVYELNQYERDA